MLDDSAVTRRGFLVACGLTAAGCATTAPPAARSTSGGDPYRLPTTVVPRRYELRIAPDFVGRRFSGTAVIEVAVREPVTEIVLNAAELTIAEATISRDGGRALRGAVALEVEAERARIRFGEVLAPGTWRLALAFAGPLEESLRGFYRVRAQGRDGAETALAITQFQAADARRAFPCWDEPAFKAVFDVTLVVDRRLLALSNGAAVGEAPTPEPGARAIRFAPTVPMSTYLVAFVVGELEATAPRAVEAVPVRVWGLPARTALGSYGLDVAAFSLRFLGDFFGVPYPGDKLDLIGVPDFASGAMENLGAVIFRETNLFVDERRASLGELRAVADNVSHEVAHMWFGDLVTMAWWNGLWLNEAFATFMALLVVDAWRPAWQRWGTFAVARASALEVDGLSATRPVEYPVRTPTDAEAMFDQLTYKKGAAILRMIERHLGTDVFRRGVRAYLAKHRFANAETGDLWAALGEASQLPVGRVMDTWVHRPGYPLVTVSLEPDGRSLVVTQQRFSYLGAAARPDDFWGVPVHVRMGFADGVRSARRVLLSAELRVELADAPRWIVLNADGDGFYRTRYSPDLLARLAADVRGLLSPVERFALVDDAWAVTLAGLSSVTEFLDLTARFRGDDDRNVLAGLIDALTMLERLVDPAERPALAALVRDRLGPTGAAVGPPSGTDESEARRELRADLLRALGTLGDDAAAQERARQLYRRYREDPGAVDASLSAAAVAVTAHVGGAAEYADFLDRYRTAPTPQERSRSLVALGRFRDPALVERTQRLILDGTIRAADAPFTLRQMFLSVSAREATWRFVVEHGATLRRSFTQAGLAILCEGLVGLATPELERSVREFVATHKVSLGGNVVERELERLRIAVALREREGAALRTYLGR